MKNRNERKSKCRYCGSKSYALICDSCETKLNLVREIIKIGKNIKRLSDK